MIEKIFVLGTGRCGTHTLNEIFNTIPDTVSLHEGRGYYSGCNVDLGAMNGLNIYLYHSLNRVKTEEEFYNLSGNVLKLLDKNFTARKKFIETLEKKEIHYCDVNRMGYNYIDYIRREYPEAKFIHLIRNGYDCVKSWHKRTGAYPNPKTRFRKKKNYIFEKLIIRNLGINNTLSPIDLYILSNRKFKYYAYDKPIPMEKILSQIEWNNYDRLEKISWFWAYTNNIINDKLMNVPEHLRKQIKIEEFNVDRVKELLEFAGLKDDFDKSMVKAHDVGKNLKLVCSEENKNKFNRIAGDTMLNFGYQLR